MYDNYDYRLATIKTKHVKGNIQCTNFKVHDEIDELNYIQVYLLVLFPSQ